MANKPQRRGYMYTPFGGREALHSALGENMARLSSGKSPRGLLASSHQKADELEQIRQHTLTNLGRSVTNSENQLRQIPGRFRQADNDLLARIRASVEHPGATAQSTREARRDAKADHSMDKTMLSTTKLQHEANLSVKRPQRDALQATRILNTSPGIYPDLFPRPLAHVRPDTPYSAGDKLYILGHGAPNSDRIYAQGNGLGGSMSAKELADHLQQAGLHKNAVDLRLTACQGVPVVNGTGDPVQKTKNSGSLVPEVAKEMGRRGYNHLTVTGYQGNGVTFPFNSNTHLRSSPDDDHDRVRRQDAAISYSAREMRPRRASFSSSSSQPLANNVGGRGRRNSLT